MKTNTQNISSLLNLLEMKKNLILQGGPGTGKTHTAAALALAAVDPDFIDFSDTATMMNAYNRQMLKVDKNGNVISDGQIGFLSFHQHMDYKSFDIFFRAMVMEAKYAYVEKIPGAVESAALFDLLWKDVVNDINDHLSGGESLGFAYGAPASMKTMMASDVNDNEITLVNKTEYGKTVAIVKKNEVFRLWQAYKDAYIPMLKDYYTIKNYEEDFSKYIEGNLSAYCAILQSILEVEENPECEKCRDTSVKLEQIATLTADDYKRTDVKKYVLVIDEMNRGNITKIFGEKLSLLDSSNRLGSNSPLAISLPGLGENASIPPNLYIICTLNPADFDDKTFDYAAQRRFAVHTLTADENVIRDFYRENDALCSEALSKFNAVKNFLMENKSKGYDLNDIMLGQSFFMANSLEELDAKWTSEVIAMLKKYKKNKVVAQNSEIL